LKALEAKAAEQGLILTEAQVAALEKKRQGMMKSAGKSTLRIQGIWVPKTPFMSTPLKESDGFISKPLSIPTQKSLLPSCILPKPRLQRLIC